MEQSENTKQEIAEEVQPEQESEQPAATAEEVQAEPSELQKALALAEDYKRKW